MILAQKKSVNSRIDNSRLKTLQYRPSSQPKRPICSRNTATVAWMNPTVTAMLKDWSLTSWEENTPFTCVAVSCCLIDTNNVVTGAGVLDYTMDRSVRPKMADPYPSQAKLHALPRKHQQNYNHLGQFIGLFLSKQSPCQIVGAENNALSRQRPWKTYPWGRHIPRTQTIPSALPDVDVTVKVKGHYRSYTRN